MPRLPEHVVPARSSPYIRRWQRASHSPLNQSRPIESPCVNVCVMNPAASYCAGCGRTLAEIAGWGSLTPADRRRIMSELPGRMRRLEEK